MSNAAQISCDLHGEAFETFICSHLAENPVQTWYSMASTLENQWPDSWCSTCHSAYLRENEWNEKNEGEIEAKLFCHRCYEAHRAIATCAYIAD